MLYINFSHKFYCIIEQQELHFIQVINITNNKNNFKTLVQLTRSAAER